MLKANILRLNYCLENMKNEFFFNYIYKNVLTK